MNSDELTREILRGKELFSETVRVLTDFVERFAELGSAEIHGFERKRQALLDTLLIFHADLKQRLPAEEKDLSLAMTRQLDEFRIYQEVFLQIVMEKDSAIIAGANRSLVALQDELAAIGRGKLALRGYARKRGISANYLDRAG